MAEDIKPKEEEISDVQPKDDKIPDAQPENEVIPDTKPKKPFSRSEYHGIITSYAGLALSLIAIILSVITMYQSHIMETREAIQILQAEDDGYYHFDGETLFKNFQVTVANNSAIPVSVVEITIERDGETRTFEISDLSDILPLNMDANHTEMITIPWNIDTSMEDTQKIRNVFSEETLSDSDIVISSKDSPFEDGALAIWMPSDDNTRWKLTSESEFANSSSLENVSIPHEVIIYSENKAPIIVSEGMVILANQSTLNLTITLCTAKNNQYLLTTQDTGSPANINEGSWVANRVKRTELPLTIRDFIEAMHIAQKSQEQSKEED